MRTVTLPNVVEPIIDWSAPVDKRDACNAYATAMLEAIACTLDYDTAIGYLLPTLTSGVRLINDSTECW